MLKYVSSMGGSESVDLETAVLQGKALNGGLFVPTQLPTVGLPQLSEWQGLSYPQLAFEILSLFIDARTVPAGDLKRLVEESFATFSHPDTIPHRVLDDGIIVQELFHGPSLSFKDVAMGFVVNLFDYFLARRGERRTIMVATSGDTGPAAAAASIGKSTLTTWLFFPEGLITNQQVRQMTTVLESNVYAVSVSQCRNGSDDLDELISHCFADDDFRNDMCLSSVNSINWARVMTQIVHYFYGYLQNAAEMGDKVHFSVPCGAFGNMCAGVVARRMGLPIAQLIVATNTNEVLATVLKTGGFHKGNIKNTLASAIDISVPMNFWRHVYFSLNFDVDQVQNACRKFEASGGVTFSADQRTRICDGLKQFTVNDHKILETIKAVWQSDGYLLDPHGAVAVAAAKHHRGSTDSWPMICLATAHPAKFPEITKLAIGQMPNSGQHESIENARTVCERKYCCDYRTMKTAVPNVMRLVARST